ncbi:MAG: LysE family translocator [Cyanobacteria bacterium P01_A01_bin.37]
MPNLSVMSLFLAAAAALLLMPGPVVMYTVARSIHQGRQAGLVSILAIGMGDFCHVLAAAFGLSALLASSALAFMVVKYAGAAYLIYLGVRTLLSPTDGQQTQAHKPMKLSRVFYQGLLVSILNPKTALFFLAFLPQFVAPNQSSVLTQVIILGCLFVGMGILTNTVYALAASRLGRLFRNNLRVLRTQHYFTGSIYITLGLATALTGSSDK